MTASASDHGRRRAPVVPLSLLSGGIIREVAESGEPITVTAHGRPLAVITPAVEGQTPGFDDEPAAAVRLRAGAASDDGDDEPPLAAAA